MRAAFLSSSNDRRQTDFVSTSSFHLTTIIVSVQLTQIKLRGIPLPQVSVLPSLYSAGLLLSAHRKQCGISTPCPPDLPVRWA